MEEMGGQVDKVDEETGIVKDLYELIEKYQVPVPPEDLAVYQVRKGLTSAVCVLGRGRRVKGGVADLCSGMYVFSCTIQGLLKHCGHTCMM